MASARVINRFPQFVAERQFILARAILAAVTKGGSEVAPFTPRESSNLILSAVRHVEQRGTAVVGTFAYTADYALAVHEAPGKFLGLNIPRASGKGVYWGPSGEPHFVTKGFERAKPAIHQIIRGALKV